MAVGETLRQPPRPPAFTGGHAPSRPEKTSFFGVQVASIENNYVRVSVHTTRRVMEDAGYRPPKVVRQKHDRHYEAVRPNHLWHLDFVQRYIGRVSTFTLILIDDCARYVVGHGVDDAERAEMVIRTFEEATEKHGRPERVMTDKGSAFWSWKAE